MSYAGASKRAIQARSGRSGRGGAGMTTLTAADGRSYRVTNGSVINYGGVDKFGLYPTVGVSLGFLNILEACCSGSDPKTGVNTNSNVNTFLM